MAGTVDGERQLTGVIDVDDGLQALNSNNWKPAADPQPTLAVQRAVIQAMRCDILSAGFSAERIT